MADAKKLLGGLGKVGQRLLASDKELTAAERAEAGRKAAALIQAQPQVKPSEALGQLMETGVKRTTTTQADRTRVGGGNIGGASFPAISEADPAYAGRVWGVMDEGTAARLKNLTAPDTAWTTMLGSANQLKTNPIVFDKLKRGFQASMKEGKLSPELAGRINHNLALTFGEGADIRDPKIWRQADTFEKRAALADVMMGQGIAPGKGGVAIGGEKSGKGVIFRPTDILKRETEPSLLHTEHGGDVPTFAAGPRLFRIERESEFRPDLHPGFPTLLTGKDYGINMKPTPTEVYLPDWHSRFKKNNPERKGPGYYDLALGVKGEGLPSQDLNDEYIRHLLREGFKDGGEVDIDAADARLEAAVKNKMANGGGVDIAAADARLAQALSQHMAGGGKAEAVKGAAKGFKRLFAEREVLPAAQREANFANFLAESKTPMRLYHGTTATEGGKGEEAIRRIKPSKEGALGSGTYLTPKPNFAGEYASEMGGNMLPVHAQVRNPLVIEGTGDPMIEALTKLGVDPERASRMVERAYDQKGYIGKEVETRARAAGYDGLMQYRNGELNEVVTYNPNAVKSAIGNEGTYDTSVPDLSKADGGKIVKGIAQVGKRLLASGEEAPKVDRLSMSYKDVTKRVPEVADAVEQLFRGEITKAQYNDIVNLYKPVTPYNFVPKPATKDEAIGALRGDTAKSRYGKQEEYEPGTKVGLRLDIPAYTNKGVWVNSIHDQKAKKVAYGATSSVKNAELGISQTQSKKIAQGGEKQPYARVVGDWNPMSDEEAIARAQEYLNHPEWRQIGLDPERHAYFYDRATMQPITAAEEVIQIGPLVLGKNPKYANIDDFEYADGGYATMLPFAGGGKAIKGGLNAIKRVFKTTDGYTFKEMPDGSVTNGDMTWNSAKEFMQDMPHSYQQGDELGQRRAFMDSYGAPSYEKFMEKLSGFMPADDPQAALQRALNEQRSQGTLKYTKGENKVGLQLVPPIEKKADGGGAFKKLDFYGGGGLTTSGGTFTPEDLGVTSAELNAPVISKERMSQIRRNASELWGEGKEQLEKEYRQLSRPGGKKDFAIRVGSQLLGGVPDLINLGLEGVDLVQSAIPGLGKAASVLDTAGTGDRIPKFRLASDEPWLGSQLFMRKFKEAELLGKNEFPLTELAAGFASPAIAAGAIKGGKKAVKAVADTQKKRRGGLTAMTR